MTRRIKIILAVLALAALVAGGVLVQVRQSAAPKLYSVSWFDVFDTVTIVSGYADSEDEWQAQADALHADLLRYHRLYDIYNHYDGITNLYDVNLTAGAVAVPVGEEIASLLSFGKQMYALTDGADNIAAGRVLALWHDARTAAETAETAASLSTASLPDEAALQAASVHCKIEDLQLDETAGTVRLADPELRLDVGSIGKGYAVEQCAQAAEARGLTSALLNVGGNVRAIGAKPDGSAWVAGIEDPWPDAEGNYSTATSIAAVALQSGESLVISGDYQRYFTVDGVRYHHLIDLSTLQPARYMCSVAVLCGSSAEGDALSTGLFCMPVTAGQALVESLDGVEALWMTADGSILPSSGFSAHLTK